VVPATRHAGKEHLGSIRRVIAAYLPQVTARLSRLIRIDKLTQTGCYCIGKPRIFEPRDFEPRNQGYFFFATAAGAGAAAGGAGVRNARAAGGMGLSALASSRVTCHICVSERILL